MFVTWTNMCYPAKLEHTLTHACNNAMLFKRNIFMKIINWFRLCVCAFFMIVCVSVQLLVSRITLDI